LARFHRDAARAWHPRNTTVLTVIGRHEGA